jgi:hypothetical protein
MDVLKKKKVFRKKIFFGRAGILILLILLILSSLGTPISSTIENYPTLGDFIWEDLDKDGIQDPGEPGIEGVTVELYVCDGNKYVDSKTTDENGYYLFRHQYGSLNIHLGAHYLKFILPSGYEFTLQDQGTDAAMDSDADPTTGKTACTTLVWGEHDLTWDAGLVSEEVEECNPCDGKVTQLTLQYTGASSATIKVEQKKNKVVFNEEVDPNEEFTIYGVDKKGTLGTEIKIYVNDVLNTKIHTSCSQPIGPGLVSGDFEVIEGYSKDGGKLPPL